MHSTNVRAANGSVYKINPDGVILSEKNQAPIGPNIKSHDFSQQESSSANTFFAS